MKSSRGNLAISSSISFQRAEYGICRYSRSQRKYSPLHSNVCGTLTLLVPSVTQALFCID